MVDGDYWRKYSYVMRGKQRRKILAVLDGPQLVSHIAKKSSLSLAETSRVLKGLVQKGLAECKNPQDHLGRVYGLTKEGYKIQKELINA